MPKILGKILFVKQKGIWYGPSEAILIRFLELFVLRKNKDVFSTPKKVWFIYLKNEFDASK